MFRCRYLQCEVRQNESKTRNLLKTLLMSNREINVKSVCILLINLVVVLKIVCFGRVFHSQYGKNTSFPSQGLAVGNF